MIEFPEKLQFLFQPSRYKVLYGGRGGAKSWGIARALLIKGAGATLRILCAREFQSSIQDSVHRLLSDQIEALGLSSFYNIQKSSIQGSNGTSFSFEGIRHNVSKIKSYEGADICWVEEADQVSRSSWEVIIPTIRKEGSEIWASLNPQLETDETYKRFITNPPPDAIVRKVNWSDNPWFPEVLRKEMEHLKLTDTDAYLNIWEGHCRVALEGAIYARELRVARESGRITRVPYDPTKPVHTFWDLGWSDLTAIWFAQAVGFEYRIIDFYQDRQKSLNHYIKELQNKEYIYGTDWLPHDAQNSTLAAAGRSIESLMRASGRRVRIIPKLSVEHGINAARTIFPNCWFDEDKCSDGIQALTHYRYEVDPDTKQFSKKPYHDDNSNGADAFRYMALSLKEPKNERPKAENIRTFEIGPNNDRKLTWMGN